MACYQSASVGGVSGSGPAGGGGYATEADCLNACKEGACCTGTTCSVTPQCQCQGTGKTFKGVGTTCATSSCGCCGTGGLLPSGAVSVSVARALDVIANSSCACATFSNPPAVATRCRNDSVTLSQVLPSNDCLRSVSGTMTGVNQDGGTYRENQNATVSVTSGCMLLLDTSAQLFTCGGAFVFFAWPFVASQQSYSARYYRFMYVTGSGASPLFVTTTSSSVSLANPPASPNASYFFAGSMWTIDLSVTFA